MSALERYCREPGCLQCWAEAMVARTPEEIEAELERQIREEPMSRMVGQPSAEEMAAMRRSGRREIRLLARTALLEPHECGKEQVAP